MKKCETMKCKLIHKKLIFFLEGSLPNEEMESISRHLQQCAQCQEFANTISNAMAGIGQEKQLEPNPFFYTRLKGRIENEAEAVCRNTPVFLKILQPVTLSALLVIAVYFGVKIGQVPYNTPSSISNEIEIVPFLDEMENETIETFLMD